MLVYLCFQTGPVGIEPTSQRFGAVVASIGTCGPNYVHIVLLIYTFSDLISSGLCNRSVTSTLTGSRTPIVGLEDRCIIHYTMRANTIGCPSIRRQNHTTFQRCGHTVSDRACPSILPGVEPGSPYAHLQKPHMDSNHDYPDSKSGVLPLHHTAKKTRRDHHICPLILYVRDTEEYLTPDEIYQPLWERSCFVIPHHNWLGPVLMYVTSPQFHPGRSNRTLTRFGKVVNSTLLSRSPWIVSPPPPGTINTYPVGFEPTYQWLTATCFPV